MYTGKMLFYTNSHFKAKFQITLFTSHINWHLVVACIATDSTTLCLYMQTISFLHFQGKFYIVPLIQSHKTMCTYNVCRWGGEMGGFEGLGSNTEGERSHLFHQWTIKSNFKQNAFTSGRLTVNNTVSNKSLNMRQTELSFIKQ